MISLSMVEPTSKFARGVTRQCKNGAMGRGGFVASYNLQTP